MNRKIIWGLAALVLVTGGVFMLIRYKKQNPQAEEIRQFISDFNYQLQSGKTELIVPYFDSKAMKKKTITRLINILSGKTGLNGKTAALFSLSLDPAHSVISIINNQYSSVIVSVNFKHDSLPQKQSITVFKIRQFKPHRFKIIKVDNSAFYTDYLAYQATIKNPIQTPDSTIYSPITLAAFKTAEKLRGKYDSIPWFQHLNGETYFYVAKGKMNVYISDYENNSIPKEKTFKMGLVNPQEKEIIPVEYDLIHNINGTIEGMVEVEKNDKKGLFDLAGKNVVPAIYDQIYPLSNADNVALLLNGDDYFYLKSDLAISDKLSDFKIADVVQQIKYYSENFRVPRKNDNDIMEMNDGMPDNSMVFPPSYLVDWSVLPKLILFPNPLIKSTVSSDMVYGVTSYEITSDHEKKQDNNLLLNIFNLIVGDFLGDRGGLYEKKNVVMVDKRSNKIRGFTTSADEGSIAESSMTLTDNCNDNYLRAINDTLFEFKTTTYFNQDLLNGQVVLEGPAYHYLALREGKLIELPNQRVFGFTKFVKMDDSYLNGCYVLDKTRITGPTIEMLQYAKNEIYASYFYKFKNPKWTDVFANRFNNPNNLEYTNVDNSLTVIDKYNINWIVNKLAMKNNNSLAVK